MKLLLALSLVALLLTGCAGHWPAGSSLDFRGTGGFAKDGGSIGGKAVLHIPLG